MSQLPKGWKEIQIKDLSPVVGGGTPSTSKKEFFDGEIAWVTPADLSGYKGTYISRGRRNITQKGLESSSARLLPKGSVLYSTRAPIGYVAIAENPLATNQGFKSILPSEKYDSKYAYYYLRSIKAYAESEASGTTFKELSGKKFGELRFPLAPLPEQRRIVAKLDTLFGHLDQLRARLDKIPGLLKQFRQAVLTQAVTGKLTEEWRGRERVKDGCERVSLNNVCSRITVGFVGKMLDQYTEDGIPFLRSQNVRPFKFSEKGLLYVSPQFHKSILKSRISAGDVVIVRSGYPGTTCVIPKSIKEANCSDILIATPTERLLSEYLAIFMNSSFGKTFVSQSKVGIAQAHFNTTVLKETVIPLPSIKEQKEVVRRVESLFALADSIEASYRSLNEKVEQLPKIILSMAFLGDLVTENNVKGLKASERDLQTC